MRFALLLVLLAGCFAHCDYTPTDAHWEDPALWAAVDAPIAAPQGMDIGVEHVRLVSVAVGGGHARAHYYDGALHASSEAADADERLGDAARRILNNATAGEDVEAHVQAFLDSRTLSDLEMHRHVDGESQRIEVYEYHHPVAIDAALLLENLGMEPTARGVGQGPFNLAFSAATKEFSLDRLGMSVDFFGGAGAGRDWPEGTPDEDVKAEIKAALQAAGLPVPDDVEVQGFVC